MRDLAAEVLTLQRHWTGRNTPEMQRRGILIRHEIPAWIREHLTQISSVMSLPNLEMAAEGRDGTGQKTEIPWSRLYCRNHSPNAREGWYCVFLFHASGEGFYLCLGHGSTRLIDGAFKPRSPEELQSLVVWARNTLAPNLDDTRFTLNISLGARGELGDAYEQGTAVAIWYPETRIPSTDALAQDLLSFSALLGKLYAAEDLGRVPDASTREAEAIQEVIRPTRVERAGLGQGFGLTNAERLAVERHAMHRATIELRSRGYSVRDVSRNHPYDLVATKDGESVIIEVKGTTGVGAAIILTAGEVAAHRERFPRNGLVLVSSIDLNRSLTVPIASGGRMTVMLPWELDSSSLRPLSYQYGLALPTLRD